MQIKYNKEKIHRIICDLSELTGISIAFLDRNYNKVCRCSSDNDFCTAIQNSDSYNECKKSDMTVLEKCKKSRRFENHICHAGLYDAAMPIIKDEIFAGVIIMGRVRLKGADCDNLLLKNPHFKELYYKMPELSERQIESLKSLFPNILFQNGIIIEYDNLTERICKYIDDNINQKLSLADIGTKFLISKNKLYEAFRENFDCTVNEYIIKYRIEKAQKLLTETDEPVYIIAEKVGIYNYTYFCRLFKRMVGVTPMQYRK